MLFSHPFVAVIFHHRLTSSNIPFKILAVVQEGYISSHFNITLLWILSLSRQWIHTKERRGEAVMPSCGLCRDFVLNDVIFICQRMWTWGGGEGAVCFLNADWVPYIFLHLQLLSFFRIFVTKGRVVVDSSSRCVPSPNRSFRKYRVQELSWIAKKSGFYQFRSNTNDVIRRQFWTGGI